MVYIKSFILFLIRFYKKTEPLRKTIAQNLHLTVGECRFTPTCSEYMYGAVEKYGVLKGITLGSKRILRCNPSSPRGYDPIV